MSSNPPQTDSGVTTDTAVLYLVQETFNVHGTTSKMNEYSEFQNNQSQRMDFRDMSVIACRSGDQMHLWSGTVLPQFRDNPDGRLDGCRLKVLEVGHSMKYNWNRNEDYKLTVTADLPQEGALREHTPAGPEEYMQLNTEGSTDVVFFPPSGFQQLNDKGKNLIRIGSSRCYLETKDDISNTYKEGAKKGCIHRVPVTGTSIVTIVPSLEKTGLSRQQANEASSELEFCMRPKDEIRSSIIPRDDRKMVVANLTDDLFDIPTKDHRSLLLVNSEELCLQAVEDSQLCSITHSRNIVGRDANPSDFNRFVVFADGQNITLEGDIWFEQPGYLEASLNPKRSKTSFAIKMIGQDKYSLDQKNKKYRKEPTET